MTNNEISTCGGRSLHIHGEDFELHTNHRHTTHKESSDANEHSEDSSVFYVPITYKAITNITYNEAKALAFLCLIRAYEQKTNSRGAHTINSLHELTGVHAKTIEDRIDTLNKMNLIGYNEVGKILIKKAKAKHPKHNTILKIRLDENALKNAEDAVLAARIVNKLK